MVVMDRMGNIKLNELSKILDDDAFIGYINQRVIFLSEKFLK